MQKQRIDSLYPNYFAFPAVIIYTVFFVMPILAAFVLSFTDWHIMRLFSPNFIGFENFIYLFKDTNFILALKNTFIFAFFTMVFKVLFIERISFFTDPYIQIFFLGKQLGICVIVFMKPGTDGKTDFF